MRQGLKDRIQFNPSNPSRMNFRSTDFLLRNSYNRKIGNAVGSSIITNNYPAVCVPNGSCSNVQDASGFWVLRDQVAQQTQRQYYAPFRQPLKGFRKTLDCNSGSPDISSCMLTTEIYKDNYSNIDNSTGFCCPNGSLPTTNIPQQSGQQPGQTPHIRSSSGNVTRTNKPLIRSGMQPNTAGQQNSGLSNTLIGTKYSYSYRELINNRRKATQIKKLSTQQPTGSTFMSNPQQMPGFGGNCPSTQGGCQFGPGQTTYRYNNPNFAVQGAVEASDRITRLKLDTIRAGTNCPAGQTAQHTGNNCNGIYRVGNIQYADRTIQWPIYQQQSTNGGTDLGPSSQYTKVKYKALFNNQTNREINNPQLNALTRVRGATRPKRRTDGRILPNNNSVCPTNCPPQFLM